MRVENRLGEGNWFHTAREGYGVLALTCGSFASIPWFGGRDFNGL